MIINIRSTNGAGKTTLIQALMQEHGWGPILRPGGFFGGDALGVRLKDRNVRIPGKYTLTGRCSGLDGMTTEGQESVENTVRSWESLGHVVFESLMVSGIMTRWEAFANASKDFRFLFLDTPLEECIQRVEERRRGVGNTEDLDPRNVISKHKSVESIRKQLIARGCRVYTLNCDDALNLIEEWIE